jgi:plasmid segregation protein ParM
MYKKNVDVLAWDNGFGVDKFMVNPYSFNEMERIGRWDFRLEEFSFQSVYCTYSFPRLKPAASNLVDKDRGLNKNKLVIEYKGITYAVGPFAIDQDAEGGAISFDKKKFRKETEIIKLLVSIAYFFPLANEVVVDKLVVGLSLEAYEEYHQVLTEQYTNFESTFKVLTIGDTLRNVNVTINETICIPQGQGALYDAILGFGPKGIIEPSSNGRLLLDQRFGILDVGDKTIDAFVTTGTNPVQKTDFWLEHGLSLAYENIHDKIKAPANLIELSYLNKRPLHYENDYSYAKLAEMCQKEFRDIADEIFEKIDEKWNKHYPRMQFILLCGGGGVAIQERLAERLKEHTKAQLKLAENPQFANVSGYYKLGIITLQKERRQAAAAVRLS